MPTTEPDPPIDVQNKLLVLNQKSMTRIVEMLRGLRQMVGDGVFVSWKGDIPTLCVPQPDIPFVFELTGNAPGSGPNQWVYEGKEKIWDEETKAYIDSPGGFETDVKTKIYNLDEANNTSSTVGQEVLEDYPDNYAAQPIATGTLVLARRVSYSRLEFSCRNAIKGTC